MTLDVKVLLRNLLRKQMSIQHFTAKHDVFEVDTIPSKIKTKIQEEFGDNYLLDADYVVFFRGKMTSDQIKKLYNLTNKAFGEDANRLVEGDFKKISLVKNTSSNTEEETKEVGDQPDDQSDQAEAEAASEEVESDKPLDEEVIKILSEGKDSISETDETDNDIVNEDDSTKPLDEDVQIDSSINAYVFLKITIK